MMRTISQAIRPTIALLLCFTLLFGVIYTGAVTLIGRGIFPFQAKGSVWRDEHNMPLGSALIGQEFTDPKYLWGRPSATLPPYNASASTASNYAVGNPLLHQRIEARITAIKAADPANMQTIPVDLVTASASGLDPDISFAAADYQLRRIVQARQITEDALRTIYSRCARDRMMGVLGEPHINVLCVNLALDGRSPSAKR